MATGSPSFSNRSGRPPGWGLFYYWGSSRSRDSDDRIEAKLDALLRAGNIDPQNPRVAGPGVG
ncbi:hypothetical protein Vqi01_02610 [Micromonospora qiuiae]|uniref:Uncharacterized protein n=1 Tax=Micromonospora qiuiae TaxID=502268 RepID=A0ABQ4J4L7_9ACTN|nr:hypothetical protein [Micromonospora qiuiae]GIJ25099.1 hypothetical protein Vqi01_02610 [Micromonospora qiuiae]